MSNLPSFHHILVIEDEKSRRVIHLEEELYSIGRDAVNTIVIYDRQVSRFHACLVREKESKTNNITYKIKDGDLKGNISTNGLNINGKPCIAHELKHGDIVRFAGQAKAIYYIIDNPSVISLFKNGEAPTQVSRSKTTLNPEDYKTTMGANPELQNLTQEELFRLASFPELSPNPIIEIDWEGNITYINPSASLKFKDLEQLKIKHPIIAGLTGKSPNRNGSLFVREVKINAEVFEQYVHYLPEGKLIRSYIFDFTKRKQVETALRESEELYRAVIKQSSDSIFLVDAITKKIMDTNSSYCKLIGYSQEELLTLTVDDLSIDQEVLGKTLLDLKKNPEGVGQIIQRKKDGDFLTLNLDVNFINYGGKEIFCCVVRKSMTSKTSEEIQEYSAFHDLLTDLPNRNLFNEHLATAMGNAKTHQHLMGLMIIDIDQFEDVLENHGNGVADKLLKGFAQRLKYCLRSGDLVARWGEDQFTVLLPEINQLKDIAKIAQRLSQNLEQPFDIEEKPIQVKSSIGIALYPQDGEDSPVLLKNADSALSRTKMQGRNHYQFFSPTMTSNASRLLRLEGILQEAIDKQELSLYYQPIVNINTGELTGMEVSLRWQHPELERMSAESLTKLAQEASLILPLNHSVIANACIQNKIWQQMGFAPFPIAVNLSSQQFQQTNLVMMISDALNETGLDPRWLELEITEKAIMENTDLLPKTLRELLQIGIKISIDDFGTGYCSLINLKRFPFHALKIDNSFIKELKDKSPDMGIITSITTLGRSFNMRVIAEGVERQQQLELLRRLNCEEIQGNIFSQPLSAENATNFLKRHQKTG